MHLVQIKTKLFIIYKLKYGVAMYVAVVMRWTCNVVRTHEWVLHAYMSANFHFSYCDLVTLYGDMDLDIIGSSKGVWPDGTHQVITCIYVDLSSNVFFGIHMRAIS